MADLVVFLARISRIARGDGEFVLYALLIVILCVSIYFVWSLSAEDSRFRNATPVEGIVIFPSVGQGDNATKPYTTIAYEFNGDTNMIRCNLGTREAKPGDSVALEITPEGHVRVKPRD